MIGTREVEGFEALTLASEEGGIEAAFVPAAGMVGCSLRHRGDELLGQRGGLRHYVAERSTMGIPLLYPWANRVSKRRFAVAGREIDLDSHPELLSLDPNGLPIHGLLAGAPEWRVELHEAADHGGVLRAAFDFSARPDLLAAFPFPHELAIEARLAGAELTITTTVRASGGAQVPISFGYHPYFRLPGADRAEWEIEIPVRERIVLGERGLPTGEREPAAVEAGALGSRTFDDGYLAPPDSQPLAVAAGGRRIELSLRSGYPYTQVYAPDDDEVIALEPMTAPTNALVTGGSDLRLIEPGESLEASFSIRLVSSAAPGA
jgi:aldose 1-epimerase